MNDCKVCRRDEYVFTAGFGQFLNWFENANHSYTRKNKGFFCLFVLPICNHLSFRSDTCFSLLLFKVATSNLGNLLFRKAVIFVCSDHSSVARYFVSVGQWIEEKCFALSSTQCYPPHVEWDLRQSLHQSTLCWKSCGFWLVSAQQWRN